MEGALQPSEVHAAFRRLAQTHPDAGGSNEECRIADARHALLEHLERA